MYITINQHFPTMSAQTIHENSHRTYSRGIPLHCNILDLHVSATNGIINHWLICLIKSYWLTLVIMIINYICTPLNMELIRSQEFTNLAQCQKHTSSYIRDKWTDLCDGNTPLCTIGRQNDPLTNSLRACVCAWPVCAGRGQQGHAGGCCGHTWPHWPRPAGDWRTAGRWPSVSPQSPPVPWRGTHTRLSQCPTPEGSLQCHQLPMHCVTNCQCTVLCQVSMPRVSSNVNAMCATTMYVTNNTCHQFSYNVTKCLYHKASVLWSINAMWQQMECH